MVSGIYKITNITNGKFYIGSSCNYQNRRREHFQQLRRGVHKNRYLQRSFNKTGEDNLIFEVIEEVNKKNLITREQYYIDTLNPEYNLCRVAYSVQGLKHSKKTKKIISKANKGKIVSKKTRERLRIATTGSTRSKLTREKLRIIAKKRVVSEEQRVQMAKSRWKPVLQLDLNGNIIKEYESAKAATEAIGTHRSTIPAACKRGHNVKGFKWRYKNIVQ